VVAVAKNGTTADQNATDVDNMGRTVGVSDAAGHHTTITYASSDPGGIASVALPSGLSGTVTRDTNGNPTRFTGPAGNYTQITWDYPTDAHFGRITGVQEFGSNGSSKSPTTYTYYGATATTNGAYPSSLRTITYPSGLVET